MLEDIKSRQNDQKDNLKIKVSILVLLFATVIVVFLIIFGNYFDIMDQSNIHADKKIVTEHNYHDKTDIIKIKTQENIKRILIDTQINTWTATNQSCPKVSTLSDNNFCSCLAKLS